MEWRDEGIILGTRRHGETSAILEVMTRAHGRHLGLVRGGRSRKQQPVLQAGNRVDLLWRARLDEHLGTFQVEALDLNAARLFDSAAAIYGLQTMAGHLRLLPERDPHERLYETLGLVIDHLCRNGLCQKRSFPRGARAEGGGQGRRCPGIQRETADEQKG